MKNTQNLIAAYGSLRKNNYNFERFPTLKYLSTHRIKGFELWDFGPYPYVVEKEDSEITVDILSADNYTKRSIDSMEHGAGYISKQIEVDGQECTIYLMKQIYPNTKKIEHGDYNKTT